MLGDWCQIAPGDRGLHERALHHGSCIFSVYDVAQGSTVWIITEADRSSTAVLLPSEY